MQPHDSVEPSRPRTVSPISVPAGNVKYAVGTDLLIDAINPKVVPYQIHLSATCVADDRLPTEAAHEKNRC